MSLPEGKCSCLQLVSLHSSMKAGNLNIVIFLSTKLLRDLVEKKYQGEKQSVTCVSSLCLQQ